MEIKLSALLQQAKAQAGVDVLSELFDRTSECETKDDMIKVIAELGLVLLGSEKEITCNNEIPTIKLLDTLVVNIPADCIIETFAEVKAQYDDSDNLIDSVTKQVVEELDNMSEEELEGAVEGDN